MMQIYLILFINPIYSFYYSFSFKITESKIINICSINVIICRYKLLLDDKAIKYAENL